MQKPLWFQVLRVEQYVKNVFVLLPLFFSGLMHDVQAVESALLMLAAFCCAASAVYLVNDMLDVQEDRNHPTKKYRPLASGKISISTAMSIAITLTIAGLGLAWSASLACLVTLAAYLLLNAFYVFYGKHRSVLDVACIATGFVLRTLGGGFSIATPTSHWLILMVFLLCMFLALGKRWDDLCITEKGATDGVVRKSLQNYSKLFVLTSMTFLSTINSVCYILYTVSPQIILQYHNEYLYLTSLWVVLGNLRYLQLAFVKEDCASPTRIFLKDSGIQACVFFWFLHVTCLIYL